MSFFLTFMFATTLSLIFTPLAILLAKKYGFVDNPKKHLHPAVIHKKTIPRGGGLPIFLTFVIVSLFLIPFTQKLLGIFLCGFVLVTVGLIDDKFDIKAHLKRLSQIIAALIVVFSGVGIAYITNPLIVFSQNNILGGEVIRLDTLRLTFQFLGQHSIIVFADLFALFWIVWVINMVNFSSGVDGQMPGIALIVFIIIYIASLKFITSDPQQLIVTNIALIGTGATLGFLVYNFYPAKIFPGDSGSYFLGFLIATLAILSGAKIGTSILIMAIPLIDGAFTIIRRIASGKSPLLGDKKHLHHRLLEIGFGQRRIALFYWILCAILGAVALSLNSAGKLFAGILIETVVVGGLLWLNMNLPIKAH